MPYDEEDRLTPPDMWKGERPVPRSDRINIRLEPALKAKLEERANAEGRTMSAMAERLLRQALGG